MTAAAKSAIESFLDDKFRASYRAGYDKMSKTLTQGMGVKENVSLADHIADANKKVCESIDANASKAIAELRAMSIRNRRSLG